MSHTFLLTQHVELLLDTLARSQRASSAVLFLLIYVGEFFNSSFQFISSLSYYQIRYFRGVIRKYVSFAGAD